MSRVNGEIEVEEGRFRWKLLASVVGRREVSLLKLGEKSKNTGKKLVGESSKVPELQRLQ